MAGAEILGNHSSGERESLRKVEAKELVNQKKDGIISGAEPSCNVSPGGVQFQTGEGRK